MVENDNATATFRLSGVFYIEFLNALHTHLTPRSYLEIGTSKGASLAVAGCDTIAVDPRFAIPAGATGDRRRTFFFQMTSDDFFATENASALLGRPVDMAFLDGLHQFEYLLRDFIGAEAACHPRSLILLHDCVPSNTRMTSRQFQPGDSSEGHTATWWTGDVWKLLPILREYRPDLRLHVLDCHPTGLVAITGLDPASSVLADRYHDIVDQHAASVLDEDQLRSFWDNLELTASRPLYKQPDRLTELFSLDTPPSGIASVSTDINETQNEEIIVRASSEPGPPTSSNNAARCAVPPPPSTAPPQTSPQEYPGHSEKSRPNSESPIPGTKPNVLTQALNRDYIQAFARSNCGGNLYDASKGLGNGRDTDALRAPLARPMRSNHGGDKMVPTSLNRDDIQAFARSNAPESALRHPGMVSEAERRALFGLAGHAWRPGSAIVDAGAFLGASTRIFCEALAASEGAQGAVYSYEFAVFNAYNAKVASELLGREFAAKAPFGDLLRSLVDDRRGVVRYHLGDIQTFPYNGATISLAFLDILKSSTLLDFVYSNFFPKFDQRTLLYQQDYFHPNHPWIACSMARYADAFAYVGQPEPEGGALNSAVFVVRDEERLPRRVDSFMTLSKAEALDYLDAAIVMHTDPVERLCVIGQRAAAEAAFDRDERRAVESFRRILALHRLGDLAEGLGQRHHVNRILRSIASFSRQALTWA